MDVTNVVDTTDGHLLLMDIILIVVWVACKDLIRWCKWRYR